MPGLSGPDDYSQEPPRHPCLHINAKASFPFVLFNSILPLHHSVSYSIFTWDVWFHSYNQSCFFSSINVCEDFKVINLNTSKTFSIHLFIL